MSCLRNAPPSILNVQVNQPVELRVTRRVGEAYVAPPKKRQAFAGTGNRLGGVVPEVSGITSTSTIPGAFPSTSSSTTASSNTFDDGGVQSINTRFEVDMNQPNTSVQIRLADGTR
jgi:UBX domain-containing protein 1